MNDKRLRCFILNTLATILLVVVSVSHAAQQYVDTVTSTTLNLEVAVDRNHDGKIHFSQLDANGDVQDSSDKTQPDKPFRFWLNDDADFVLHYGIPRLDKKECTADIWFDSGDGRQVCEQEDLLDGTSSNIANGPSSIDSIRDLEDFAALAIRIRPWQSGMSGIENLKVTLRASGFSMNVFEGRWNGATGLGEATTYNSRDHVSDSAVARSQVNAEHLFRLNDTYGLSEAAANQAKRALDFRWFDVNQDGVARLVFEGISDSGYCLEQLKNCFLEVALEDASGIVIMSQKLYMSLHSIKKYYDHRTAGSGQNQQPLANLFQYQQPQDILRLTPETPQNMNKHILFVHGWRMQFAERVSFAETSLKRLYWSGYDGKFSFLSWPTDYFRNPAYWSDTDSNVAALSDIQNYSRSEAIARRTAPLLMQWLEEIGPEVRIFAHSMGNVVVSEALRQYTGAQLTNKYVASQAAEVAGAYDPVVANLNVKLPLDELPDLIVVDECQGRPQFDISWRCMNNDSGNVQDIPPDKYRYTIPNPHVAEPNTGPQYYDGIAAKAGSVINFHNLDDVALDAWRIQQVTKPDFGAPLISDDPTWSYAWEEDPTQPGYYLDTFAVDPAGWLDPVNHEQELIWNATDVNGRGNPEILAHIIPGRTPPLGHVGTTAGVVGAQVDLNASFQFADSRYDHSAQFLSDFTTRKGYWDNLLTEFFGN